MLHFMFMLLRTVFLSKVDLGALEYEVHPGVPLKILSNLRWYILSSLGALLFFPVSKWIAFGYRGFGCGVVGFFRLSRLYGRSGLWIFW